MTGRGRAHGAVTIVNATATGVGCALAIEMGLDATWEWTGDALQADLAGADASVVEAVARTVAPGEGARVRTRASFPPSRGLKTSSSAAAALLAAAHESRGRALSPEALIDAGVAACRQAGVTLTGARDDQAAVVLGGCQLTQGPDDRQPTQLDVPRWHVAVWVPERSIPKATVRPIDTAPAVAEARRAAGLARDGDVPGAMTLNGRAFTALYASAGLPVDARPTEVALRAGALGAGLSGTGPAVAALFDEQAPLPAVPGGRWVWTRVARGPP